MLKKGVNMKKIFSVILSVMICATMASCGGDDSGYTEIGTNTTQTQEEIKPAFSIKNKLGDTVKELYISQSSTTDWGENLLKTMPLKEGATVDISLSGAELPTKVFDIAVFMADGTEYQVKNVDVSVSTEVELKLKGDKAIVDLK